MVQSIVVFLILVFAIACVLAPRKTENYGHYVGISPIAASQGASYEESQVAFSVDQNGIILDTTVVSENKPLAFKVHFTPEWIFSLQGWGVEKCLSVRQHKTSKLAQLIFCFTEDFPETKKKADLNFDVEMMLGEGMPASLGLFVRTGNPNVGSRVRGLYDTYYKPKTEEASHSWLSLVDIVEARKVMKSTDKYRKIEVLRNSTQNMWTGTDQEIKDRLELVAQGLEDPSPEIQKQALDTFSVSGRVVGGVDLVVNFLRKTNLRDDVSVAGLEAATYLLYEAHKFNSDVALLQKDFGTTDPETIQKKTNGLISPDQYDVVNKVCQQVPQTRWTLEHQVALTNAITQAVSDQTKISPEALKVATRALKEYPVIR
ncbi:MAG: hypothetical protein HY505_03155 [Candidatus Yanofskybacteria bacterium]|nr:hypothetical protein [Candidatus Yanofskybacteria bacterium]